MYILTPVITGLIAFLLILEGTSRVAYGKVIPEKDLEAFFAKHLNDYEINDISWKNRGSRMFYGGMYPYIAKGCGSLFFSWHIGGYGRILRTSKFSKILDARFAELVQKLPSNKLKDL